MDETPFLKRSIGEGLRRLLDERGEQRGTAASQTAVLEHRGRRHVARLINLSQSGAMIACQEPLTAGDEAVLHLLDHGAVSGQVRWSHDGRAGVVFSNRLDLKLDDR